MHAAIETETGSAARPGLAEQFGALVANLRYADLPPEALHVRLRLQDGTRTARLTGPARWAKPMENLLHV